MTIQDSASAATYTGDRLGGIDAERPAAVRRTPSTGALRGADGLPVVRIERLEPAASPPRTRGEVEAAICVAVSRFQQDCMGRGPADIRTQVLGDLIVVRLYGALTLTERKLATSLDDSRGRELVKQVRTHLLEAARPALQTMVERETGAKVVSLHQDLSTTTGEELIVFVLATEPVFREIKAKAK